MNGQYLLTSYIQIVDSMWTNMWGTMAILMVSLTWTMFSNLVQGRIFSITRAFQFQWSVFIQIVWLILKRHAGKCPLTWLAICCWFCRSCSQYFLVWKVGLSGLLFTGTGVRRSRYNHDSDGTSSSLRWCSSIVHVHQNQLVQLVQSFYFSQRTKRNGWTAELAWTLN